MTHHLAYGLSPQQLDIAVIEDSKPMQTVMRSILATMRPARIRVYDGAEAALSSMLQDPPNLIITDWRLGRISGYGLLRMIRQQHMQPLSFVPVIFVTAHATRMHVEKALRGGAQHLLVKPIAPARLQQCIQWVLADDRELDMDGEGVIHIHGVDQRLDRDRERWQTADRARAYHRHMERIAGEFQDEVDTIIADPVREEGDVAPPVPDPEIWKSRAEDDRRHGNTKAGVASAEENFPAGQGGSEEFGKILRTCRKIAGDARRVTA